jgi:hypothetical protein
MRKEPTRPPVRRRRRPPGAREPKRTRAGTTTWPRSRWFGCARRHGPGLRARLPSYRLETKQTREGPPEQWFAILAARRASWTCPGRRLLGSGDHCSDTDDGEIPFLDQRHRGLDQPSDGCACGVSPAQFEPDRRARVPVDHQSEPTARGWLAGAVGAWRRDWRPKMPAPSLGLREARQPVRPALRQLARGRR